MYSTYILLCVISYLQMIYSIWENVHRFPNTMSFYTRDLSIFKFWYQRMTASEPGTNLHLPHCTLSKISWGDYLLHSIWSGGQMGNLFSSLSYRNLWYLLFIFGIFCPTPCTVWTWMTSYMTLRCTMTDKPRCIEVK